jgi:hypothetical protein
MGCPDANAAGVQESRRDDETDRIGEAAHAQRQLRAVCVAMADGENCDERGGDIERRLTFHHDRRAEQDA